MLRIPGCQLPASADEDGREGRSQRALGTSAGGARNSCSAQKDSLSGCKHSIRGGLKIPSEIPCRRRHLVSNRLSGRAFLADASAGFGTIPSAQGMGSASLSRRRQLLALVSGPAARVHRPHQRPGTFRARRDP
jgi:hypothetical protein